MKIKPNRKNIVNYLKAQDLWDKNKFNDDKFNLNLNELKNINIKINQILWLYNYLIDSMKSELNPMPREESDSKSESDNVNGTDSENESYDDDSR